MYKVELQCIPGRWKSYIKPEILRHADWLVQLTVYIKHDWTVSVNLFRNFRKEIFDTV